MRPRHCFVTPAWCKFARIQLEIRRRGASLQGFNLRTADVVQVREEDVEQAFEILSAILWFGSHSGEPAEVAREYLKDAPNVTVVELEIEEGWTRDWGPSPVIWWNSGITQGVQQDFPRTPRQSITQKIIRRVLLYGIETLFHDCFGNILCGGKSWSSKHTMTGLNTDDGFWQQTHICQCCGLQIGHCKEGNVGQPWASSVGS